MARRLTLWLILIALVSLGTYFSLHPAPRERTVKHAPRGGDFTLLSADGPLRLSDFRGKVTLLYFGYTYCPDICPTSLAATAAGLKQLTPQELAQVAVVFISVDPERDTPARLKEYAAFFHPIMRGVTGSPEALKEIAQRYGVFYQRQPAATSSSGYAIDHTATTYVIDQQGALSEEIPHAAPPEAVVAAIRQHLSP